MKKRNTISLCLALAGLSVASLSIFSNLKKNSFITRASCSHNGNHYSAVMPTESSPGHLEFWACCECHEIFLTKPTSGNFVEGSEETMTGGIDESHPAYLAPKDLVVGTYSFNDEDELYTKLETYITKGTICVGDLIAVYVDDQIVLAEVKELTLYYEGESGPYLSEETTDSYESDLYVPVLISIAKVEDINIESGYISSGMVSELAASTKVRYYVNTFKESDFDCRNSLIGDEIALKCLESPVYGFSFKTDLGFTEEPEFGQTGHITIEFDDGKVVPVDLFGNYYVDDYNQILLYREETEVEFTATPGIYGDFGNLPLSKRYFTALIDGEEKNFFDLGFKEEVKPEDELVQYRFYLYPSMVQMPVSGYRFITSNVYHLIDITMDDVIGQQLTAINYEYEPIGYITIVSVAPNQEGQMVFTYDNEVNLSGNPDKLYNASHFVMK